MTTQIVAELDQIITLLEAKIPASQRSPANQRLAKRLERELAKYFKSLSAAFPYQRLDRLYTRYVEESLGSETGDILDPMLSSFDKKLKADIAGHLTNIRVAGNTEMITWGKTNAGIPIAYEGPPLQEAIDWAKTRSAKLVTQMNVESKRRIAKTISDGIKNKRGVAGIGRDIRKTFDNMSVFRGQLIARTETANALSQASLDRMKDMGIEGKEWITAMDERVSPECMGNQGEGVIPRNQTFGGGTMAPPQHPACRCALAPAILKRK